MRTRIAGLIAVLALVSPATAAAHTDFTSVTFSHPPSTFSVGGFTNLACWQQTNITPGETEYVRNASVGHADAPRLGLGEFNNWHIHPAIGEDNQGAVRRFHFPGGTQLGTRVVWRDAGGYGTFVVIKMVNDVGNKTIVIRANC